MKQRWTAAACAILTLLTGCGREKTEHTTPTLDAKAIPLECDYTDTGYGNGKLYFFDGTAADVYDAVTGIWSRTENLPGTCIEVYEDELIVPSDGEICVVKDGEAAQTIPFDPSAWGLDSVSLCAADENRIALSGYDFSSLYLEHRVILMDRETGECEDLTALLKGSYEVLCVNGMDFDDDGGLVLTVKTTTEIDNDDNMCLIWRDEEVTGIPIPRCEDGRWNGGFLWYRDGTRLKKYSFDTIASTTAGVYSPEILEELTGIPWKSRHIRMFIDGYNVILVSAEDRAVYIDRLVYDSMPLRILAPDHVHFWDQYEEILLAYRTEHRRNVEVTEIPQEAWTDKLLLKLMAQDSDFDLYWLADTASDTVLASVLDKNRYLPMEEELFAGEGIPHGADGMFRDDGVLYGVPMDLSCWLIEVNRELFDAHGLTIPGNSWTADDLWKLCADVRKLGEELYVFGDVMEISAYLLQEWLETEPDNEQALLDLAENITEYADVLGMPMDPGAGYRYDAPTLLNITWSMGLPAEEQYENALPYPRYREDTPYRFRVTGLLMGNPDSEDPEAAKDLAARLWDPADVYGKAYHDLYANGGIVLRSGYGSALGELLTDLFTNGAEEFAQVFGQRVRMHMEG